ncbi:MAG: AglZ/HisF2 family acetamidino modification protein [Deltaproteobacteria bacterium]|nr:AglZ/HisF2 family acetamidino modification protein [Deltaproteobacteria bacterium]
MHSQRIIPCLQLKGMELVKTYQFKTPQLIGDPIRAIRVFNEKKVDELIILDIQATMKQRKPNLQLITDILNECSMPVMYGGGIHSLDDIKSIVDIGVNKVILNSYAAENPQAVKMAAEEFGSNRIVVSMDVKKNFFGRYEVWTHSGTVSTRMSPIRYAVEMEHMLCGELFLNSIDRDGTRQGYDLDLIREVSEAVSIPVIACGGASNVSDIMEALEMSGASAIAAGSMFLYDERRRTISITFPAFQELHV